MKHLNAKQSIELSNSLIGNPKQWLTCESCAATFRDQDLTGGTCHSCLNRLQVKQKKLINRAKIQSR